MVFQLPYEEAGRPSLSSTCARSPVTNRADMFSSYLAAFSAGFSGASKR